MSLPGGAEGEREKCIFKRKILAQRSKSGPLFALRALRRMCKVVCIFSPHLDVAKVLQIAAALF